MPLAKKIAAGFLLALFMSGAFLAPIQPTTGKVAVAQAQSTTDLGCGLSGKDFDLCISNIVYLFAVYIPTAIANAAGYLLNFALQLGLNSASYALDFLSQGWAIVRDIANLAFIFILIYIAYTIIVQAETAGTMRMLAGVIIMALLINFSFFFTRVVIDAGNILAVQFYNALPISESLESPLSKKSNPTYVKDLTTGIMGAVGIQTLMSTDSFKIWRGKTGFFERLGGQVAIYLAVGVFLALIAFSFFIVAARLLMRVVVLWITIIASPLAFAAYAIPETHSGKKYHNYYYMWQNNLITSSLYPAVFLFLFYIMTLFLNGLSGPSQGLLPGIFDKALDPSQTQMGLFTLIGEVGIRVGLVVVLLYSAVKAADSVSQMGGDAAHSAVSWVTGKTGGLALRATGSVGGFAGRNTIGRASNAMAESKWAKNLQASNKFFVGSALRKGMQGIAGASYDARNMPGMKSGLGLIKKTGVSIDGGKAGGKGGYAKQMEERAKNLEKEAKTLKNNANDQRKMPEQIRQEWAREAAALERQSREAALINDDRNAARLKEDADKIRVKIQDEKKVKEAATGRLKELEKKRLEEFAKRVSERGVSNLWLPSLGSIEGAAKVNKLATGKSKKEQLADLAQEVEKEEKETTEKTEEKKEEKPEPLTREAMERGRERFTDRTLREQNDATMEEMLKTLKEMKHTSEAQYEETKRQTELGATIVPAAGRQQPYTATGREPTTARGISQRAPFNAGGTPQPPRQPRPDERKGENTELS